MMADPTRARPEIGGRHARKFTAVRTHHHLAAGIDAIGHRFGYRTAVAPGQVARSRWSARRTPSRSRNTVTLAPAFCMFVASENAMKAECRSSVKLPRWTTIFWLSTCCATAGPAVRDAHPATSGAAARRAARIRPVKVRTCCMRQSLYIRFIAYCRVDGPHGLMLIKCAMTDASPVMACGVSSPSRPPPARQGQQAPAPHWACRVATRPWPAHAVRPHC